MASTCADASPSPRLRRRAPRCCGGEAGQRLRGDSSKRRRAARARCRTRMRPQSPLSPGAGAMRTAAAVAPAEAAEECATDCTARRAARRGRAGGGRGVSRARGESRISPRKLGQNFFERREALRVHQFRSPSSRCSRGSGLRRRSSSVASKKLKKRVRSSSLNRAACSARRGRSLGGRGDQIRIRAADARDQQIAKMADRFAAEVLQILPVGDEPMHQPQRALGGLRCDGGDQLVQNAFGDDAEQFAHLRVRDVVAAIGDGLFEQRKAVAQAAFGGARQHGDAPGLDGQIFPLAMRSISPAISGNDSARKWKSWARELIVSPDLRRGWWPERKPLSRAALRGFSAARSRLRR